MSNRLELVANGDREIIMTRIFDASPDLVFDALTIPALLQRWLKGPDGWSLETCDIDLRVGGAYRYVWKNEDGGELAMGGTYREITRPERISQTEMFDGNWTGGEAISTATLEPFGGRTRLTTTVLYASPESRDGAIQSNMEAGITASYARLDSVLADEQQETAR
ncbi:SRPBCC family protein [Sphingomonas sp. So64.6b]|uniref:SRPBCC family protein n=1 Tax=Sphingomonas sp. So64.6b TaxID=2997354 RepID=UPI0016020260|nr:SRPBCC family protein [Sphingomonas sp. So64.6b]QNA84541.1 SRPBCC family protein [Sphingomonas sp. So64.6b]